MAGDDPIHEVTFQPSRPIVTLQRALFVSCGGMCALFVWACNGEIQRAYGLMLAICVYGLARTFFMDARWRERLDAAMLCLLAVLWAAGFAHAFWGAIR